MSLETPGSCRQKVGLTADGGDAAQRKAHQGGFSLAVG